MSAVIVAATHPIERALANAQAEGVEENLARWLGFVGHESGVPYELQALNVRFGNGERSWFAFARTVAEGAALLRKAEKEYDCPGLFALANPILPAVASRAELGKWHAARKGEVTSDADIAARAALFIDVDAQRPKGTSATDEQVSHTALVATRIYDHLASILEGSDALGVGHSGNGRAVMVALDHLRESEAAALIRGVVHCLAKLYAQPGLVEIDTSVVDAKRLLPAWGTLKRKGVAGLKERPHRRTAFVCDDAVRALGLADLERLLATLRADLDATALADVDKAMGIKPAPKSSTQAAASATKLADESPFARANAVNVTDVLTWLGCVEGDRPRCPGCNESDSGVAVVQNGMKCSHRRCQAKGYRDGFRTPVDLVAEARGVSPKEAVTLMAERFGFEGFARVSPTATTATTTATAKAPKPLLRPAERVRALAALGPVVRLETGVPTLDESCRGGLPTRRLVVLGGAPGAGKTTLATNWGWRWAKAGVSVGMLAVDEGPEGAITRIAQLEGMSPDRIEERDPATLSRLAEMLDRSGLILVDGEDDAGTVEGVAELVAKAAKGGLGVLIVDSIQTVRAGGTETVDSPRERVDAVVRALKAVRDRFGLLIIATCELARGAYRSRSIAETINDLAAFKESGSVEYAAQTALVLRSVPDEASLVDVTVPKNRAYRRDPFRLRLDHATTQLLEVELPTGAADGARQQPGQRFDAVRRAVVDVVGSEQLRSARSIVRAVRDAGHRFRDADIFDAVKVMNDEGVLVREGRDPFRIVVPSEREESEA